MPPRVEHRFYNDIEQKYCTGILCKDLEAGIEGRWKSLDNFGKESRSWDKLKKICKECKNKNERKRYEKNPKRMSEDELKESKIKRYVKTREIDGVVHKKCGGGCGEWLSIDNFSTFGKQKVIMTGEQRRNYQCRDCRNKKRNKRTKTDNNFKIKKNMRCRIYHALKGKAKSASTIDLLGCTIEELWDHIESQFVEGMTRDNYGAVWHVDHIRPCASFNLEKPEQQRKCFNWRNLQPMFGSENSSKGDKYDFDIIHEIKLRKALNKKLI